MTTRRHTCRAGDASTCGSRTPLWSSEGEGSAWFLLRARTDRAVYPVLDLYPYATTSPVYVIRDGAPIRSAEDAEYFLRWIDRLAAFAAGSKDWNSDAEREGVLATIRRAREEMEKRR